MSDYIETHPVQTKYRPGKQAQAPKKVTMRAYEVYCKHYGPQEAMVKDGCRGGFSVGELIAFLYARSFPEAEWSSRTDEAFKGMVEL